MISIEDLIKKTEYTINIAKEVGATDYIEVATVNLKYLKSRVKE